MLLLSLSLSGCFFKPTIVRRVTYSKEYLARLPHVTSAEDLRRPCDPHSRLVVDRLPPGTIVLASAPGGACSPTQRNAPVGVVSGPSRLFFEFASPRQLADTVSLLPGGVPAATPFSPTWVRDAPIEELPLYVDGVRRMRQGMLY